MARLSAGVMFAKLEESMSNYEIVKTTQIDGDFEGFDDEDFDDIV